MAFVVGESGEDREQPPVGVVRALCIGAYDMGWTEGKFGQMHKGLFLFEIEPRLSRGPNAGKRHIVSRDFPISSGENADLWKNILGPWNSKKYTSEERKSFDLEGQAGKPALLNLVANVSKSNGRTYINVGSIMPMMQGVEPIQRETPADYIPEWIKKKMEEGKRTEEKSQLAVELGSGPRPVTLKARARRLRETDFLTPQDKAALALRIKLAEGNKQELEKAVKEAEDRADETAKVLGEESYRKWSDSLSKAIDAGEVEL